MNDSVLTNIDLTTAVEERFPNASPARVWLHDFGFHWWLEDRVKLNEKDRKLTDVRICLLCNNLQRLERNYDPSRGHWYQWITVREG